MLCVLVGLVAQHASAERRWHLTVDNAVGGAVGVIAVGFQDLPGVPALGGLIWVNPLTVGYTALFVCDGTTGTAGDGSGLIALPIAASAPLVGLELVSQALILDVAAPQDFAMSPGFRAIVCR